VQIYILVTIDRLGDDYMEVSCYEIEALANKARDDAKNNYKNDKLFLSAYIYKAELIEVEKALKNLKKGESND
jgi:hypothetical protein